ncbi:MAG: M23 family metallopeptidase [Bacteroidales bacterium]|nr:M23 family metallopeptidase [Bacteroidales bacterium]
MAEGRIRNIFNLLVGVVKYALLSVLLAAVYYLVFAGFVSTDTEKRLRTENKLYEKMYPEMLEQSALVSDVIDNLELRDAVIYKDVFYASAPSLDPLSGTDFFSGSDTIPDRNILKYTARKADALLGVTGRVEAALQEVAARIGRDGAVLPPLSLPLDGVSFVQVGASLGDKMNPFYKVNTRHNGLDIIASQGDPVLAAARGCVSLVVRSFKGEGSVVEITHEGGYVTRYCHLGDILVSQGQTVPAGRKIATVGISGNSFVPHLHFEVIRDGEYQDPVHHFFASVTPAGYANMLFMSVNTGQSMD